MKKLFFCAVMTGMFLLAGCESDKDNVKTVTFEGATLVASTGGLPNTYSNILWGKESAADNGGGSLEFDGLLYGESGTSYYSYYSDYAGSYDVWGGWAISSNNDKTQTSYSNQFSVYADNASKFAVGYYMGFSTAHDTPVINFDLGVDVLSLSIANTVVTYNYCKTSSLADLYYKIVIKGFLGTTQTGSVTVDMTDCTNWRNIDLSMLGTVDKLIFEPSSNDAGAYGINVPTYFCIDNLRYNL